MRQRRKARAVENPTGSGVLLDLIRSQPHWNRRQLHEELGWSRSTLAKRLEELLSADLIHTQGLEDSTGGRPAESFSLNPKAGLILCMDLGVSHSRLAVTDLGGGILLEDEAEVLINSGPDEVLSWAVQCFDFMLSHLGKSVSGVRAVGVCVPDPVDPSTGTIRNPIMMPSWTGVSLPDLIHQNYPGVVCAWERDASARALAEQRLSWPEVQDLVYLKFGSGLSSGFILDGEIYRGATGSAGNFGSLIHHAQTGGATALDSVASGRNIQRELILEGNRIRTTSDIVKCLHQGDRRAEALLRRSAGAIGEALMDVAILLDPRLIVVGGVLGSVGEPVLGPLTDYFQSQASLLPGTVPEIVRAKQGAKAGVIGASLIAQDALFDPDRVSAATLTTLSNP